MGVKEMRNKVKSNSALIQNISGQPVKDQTIKMFYFFQIHRLTQARPKITLWEHLIKFQINRLKIGHYIKRFFLKSLKRLWPK